MGTALLPDFTFLSLVLAGWGQRQKEIFELTGVQSAAAAGMTSCLHLFALRQNTCGRGNAFL